MRVPTPAQMLQVWEQGCGCPAAERALLLLAAVDEHDDAEALARLPVGRRDALLIQLHAHLFRERIVGLARCPHCQAELEAGIDCRALLDSTAAHQREQAEPHRLCVAGRWLHFRLPDSHDLMALHALSGAGDDATEQARSMLLMRCLLPGSSDAAGLLTTLTPRESDALSQAMAAADPLADLRLDFQCPGCETRWDATFDPLRFVWEELQTWALRMLREIDLIARVYHWREADILALGPQRRRAYLELCAT